MRATSTQMAVVLGSWKEIAAYLGKGVRTVQRWEQQFGLPVRRPNGRSEGIVYATREELDRWILAGRMGRAESAKAPNGNGEACLASARATIAVSKGVLDASRQLRETLCRNIDALLSQCRTMDEHLSKLRVQQAVLASSLQALRRK